jgi:plastocyanin
VTPAHRCRRGAAIALLLVGVAASAVALGACGGGSSGAAVGPPGTGVPDDLGDVVDLTGKAEVTIDVPDNSFKPKAFKVSPSTKVTFRSTGANAHNVTPNDDGAWDPLILKAGDSKSLTAPAKAATYRFYCTIHGTKTSGQRGAVVVVPPG